MDTRQLAADLEAILYVSGDPVSINDAAHAFDLTASEFDEVISALKTRLDDSGSALTLKRYGGELQLSVRPEYSPAVESYLQPVARRSLSQSVLETLSIIAYRQPVTRGEIEEVRGVKCDYSVQMLKNRGFIEEAGHKETLGRPVLYKTTDEFLRHFGIEDISMLPDLEERSGETIET